MTTKPPYPNKFKAGDVAIAQQFIKFMDGSTHRVGEEIIVTERTKSYFNVWHHIYDKK